MVLVMISRSEVLQSFVNAATTAFREFAQDPEARRTVRQVCSALKHLAVDGSTVGNRLPVCSHLHAALAVETNSQSLDRLITQFKAVEPLLNWRCRATNDATTASENFVTGHANAMIIGPSGIEDRRDVWLGVSLLAPHVRYPEHNHEPEEVYLVISEGEFRQEEGGWFSPGIGGSFYNRPLIKHAMRSLASPLFAFWLLRHDSQP
jgi:hypothetical protein